MENIAQMGNRHKKEIVELQSNCLHADITGWIDYMWAPGHFAGKVKICENCGKTMENDFEAPFGSVKRIKNDNL